MPQIKPPGSASSMWIQVPMPTPVQSGGGPQSGMAGGGGARQPQQQQPMMPMGPKVWTPPPLLLLPHDDTGDDQPDPYGTGRGGPPPGMSRYARPGRAEHFSVWTDHDPHTTEPTLNAAHAAHEQAYTSPTLENLRAYQKAIGRALPDLAPGGHPLWERGQAEAAFVSRLLSHMHSTGSTYVPSDQVGFLRSIHDAPWDDAPRLVYADWVQEHGDPLADKVAAHIRTHTKLARAIRSGGRLPPALVAQYQQTMAGHGSPRVGELSMTPDEVNAGRQRFLTGMLGDVVKQANARRKLNGQRRYALDGARAPIPLEPVDPEERQRMARMAAEQRERHEANMAAIRARQGQPRPPRPEQWRADQLARPGRPRRYSMADLAGVYHATADKPHDHQQWMALSDILQDQGAPETGQAIQQLMHGERWHNFANEPTMRVDMHGFQGLRDRASEEPITGHVGGVGVQLHMVTGHTRRGRPMKDVYLLHVHRPPRPPGGQFVGAPAPGAAARMSDTFGIATVGRRQAAGILREMTPTSPFAKDRERALALAAHLESLRPDQEVSPEFFPRRAAVRAYQARGGTNPDPRGVPFARPGQPRRYSAEAVRGIWNAIASGGAHDPAHWNALADAALEAGHEGLAHVAAALGDPSRSEHVPGWTGEPTDQGTRMQHVPPFAGNWGRGDGEEVVGRVGPVQVRMIPIQSGGAGAGGTPVGRGHAVYLSHPSGRLGVAYTPEEVSRKLIAELRARPGGGGGGGPERFGREHTAGVHANLAAGDPKDKGMWGILGDTFMDGGADGWHHLMRKFADPQTPVTLSSHGIKLRHDPHNLLNAAGHQPGLGYGDGDWFELRRDGVPVRVQRHLMPEDAPGIPRGTPVYHAAVMSPPMDFNAGHAPYVMADTTLHPAEVAELMDEANEPAGQVPYLPDIERYRSGTSARAFPYLADEYPALDATVPERLRDRVGQAYPEPQGHSEHFSRGYTADALVRAARLAPHDDAPKLVLADHLDESGDADAAHALREFVRLGLKGASQQQRNAGGPDVTRVWKRVRDLLGSVPPAVDPETLGRNVVSRTSFGATNLARRFVPHPSPGGWFYRPTRTFVLDRGEVPPGGYETIDGPLDGAPVPQEHVEVLEGLRPHPNHAAAAPTPEQFSAWKAPGGGMVVRGIYEPGGRFVAAEAGGQFGPLGKVRRLLSAMRRKRRMRGGPGVVPGRVPTFGTPNGAFPI